ncbi:MAG: hypothetical protein WD708_01725 [Kiritimatiellia bacterium]
MLSSKVLDTFYMDSEPEKMTERLSVPFTPSDLKTLKYVAVTNHLKVGTLARILVMRGLEEMKKGSDE